MATTGRGRVTRALAAAAILISLQAVACGSLGKDSAEDTLKAVEQQYDRLKAEAKENLPEQAQLVEDAYASVKRTIASGEYMKGLKEAQALQEKLRELRTILEAKQAALQKTWESIDASVPTSMHALQARLDELQKAAKLPPGIAKDSVDAAKAALPVLSAKWDEAVAAAKSANWKVALDKADAVRKKTIELMTSVGMPVPDDWK